MRGERFCFEIKNGNKGVQIVHDGYSLSLMTMRNGFQWAGTPVDDELLAMVALVIREYQEKKK